MQTTIQPQPQLLQLQEWIRHNFNRRVVNPVTLTFAGRRRSPFTLLRHLGRKSGHVYATPVVVAATDEYFYVPLPYGSHVDWCQNILTSGRCTVVYQGQAVHTAEPTVISGDEGRLSFAPLVRWLIDSTAKRTGHNEFVRLKRVDVGEAGEYRAIVAEYPARPIVRRAALVGLIAIAGGLVFSRLLRRPPHALAGGDGPKPIGRAAS